MRTKLSVPDDELIDEFLTLLREHALDYTSTFRTLSAWLRGEALLPPGLQAWAERWREQSPDPAAMDRVNPIYIPRNHLVEEALAADDLEPLHRLVEVLRRPFDERPGLERYAAPAADSFGPTRPSANLGPLNNSGARCGASAAPRATHDAHVPEARIAVACGPRHPRLHHIGRTDHCSTDP